MAPRFSFVRKLASAAAGVFNISYSAAGPATFSPQETLGASTSAISYDSYYWREKNPKLRFPLDRFREFDNVVANDLVIAMGVRLFSDLIAAAKWEAKPPAHLQAQKPAPPPMPGEPPQPKPQGGPSAGDVAEADRIAKLVAANVLKPTRGTWNDAVKYQGADRFYDHRLQEWTADRRDDGTIGLGSIDQRPNSSIDRWIKDPNGNIAGVYQLVPGYGKYVWLPRGKLVYSADNTLTTAVEGQGLIRNAYDTHERLMRELQLEGIGNENQLAGLMVGRAPLGEIAAKYTSLPKDQADANVAGDVKHVTSVIENHTVNPSRGIVLDSALVLDKHGNATTTPKWNIGSVKGDATGLPEVGKSIDRDAFWLAILFSMEHLFLGHTGKGAYSVAQDKQGRLVDLVNAALRDLAVVMRRDLVLPIMRLNGWDERLAPDLVPADIQQLDVDLASTVLFRLAQAGELIGAPTRDKVADVFRSRLGLPERPMPSLSDALPSAKKKPGSPADPLGDKSNPGQKEPGDNPRATPAAKRRAARVE